MLELSEMETTCSNDCSNDEASVNHSGRSHQYCHEKMLQHANLVMNTGSDNGENDTDVHYNPGKRLQHK